MTANVELRTWPGTCPSWCRISQEEHEQETEEDRKHWGTDDWSTTGTRDTSLWATATWLPGAPYPTISVLIGSHEVTIEPAEALDFAESLARLARSVLGEEASSAA